MLLIAMCAMPQLVRKEIFPQPDVAEMFIAVGEAVQDGYKPDAESSEWLREDYNDVLEWRKAHPKQ